MGEPFYSVGVVMHLKEGQLQGTVNKIKQFTRLAINICCHSAELT